MRTEIREIPLPEGACPHIRREFAMAYGELGEVLDENPGAYYCMRKGYSLGNPNDPGYDRINRCLAGGPCPLVDRPDR